jgi:hypothetical protein
MKHQNPTVVSLLNAALVLLVGCTGSGEVLITHPPAQIVLHEQEPNDTQWTPNPLGQLEIGDLLQVHGELCGVPCDPADGFSFSTTGPCAIQFELVAENGVADFDLCAFDPSIGAFFLCYENGGPIESGVVLLSGAAANLHFVVMPYFGSGGYTLSLAVTPLQAQLAEIGATALVPRSSGALAYPALESGAAESGRSETVGQIIEYQFSETGAVIARSVAWIAAGKILFTVVDPAPE